MLMMAGITAGQLAIDMWSLEAGSRLGTYIPRIGLAVVLLRQQATFEGEEQRRPCPCPR